MSDGVERRNLIQAGGLAAGAAVAAMFADRSTLAQDTASRGTPVTYQPKPLTLDPKSIKGISEKVIISHYENNYVGAVKRLTAISAQLAELDFGKVPNFLINGLKREELIATNSMILHEIYFDGLGGGGVPTGALADALPATLEVWIGGEANLPRWVKPKAAAQAG
jgi:Fe-Mn family superoxide dismutase